jgi:hypothetical protein
MTRSHSPTGFVIKKNSKQTEAFGCDTKVPVNPAPVYNQLHLVPNIPINDSCMLARITLILMDHFSQIQPALQHPAGFTRYIRDDDPTEWS